MESPKFFTGALPSPPDERDYKFADIGGAAVSVTPYHSDVHDVIFNQLQSSQCGPCAIAAARYETENRQNGNVEPLSHTYVYGSDYENDGEGMYLRTVMKIAQAGIPYATSWESWGSKGDCRGLVRHNMTDELKEQAHRLRGTSYYSCGTWNEVANAVRATNGSVVILVRLYSNWYSVGKDGVVGANTGAYIGNHFLRVKDYEIMDNGVIKFRCQNSYGVLWGDNGYCYLYSDKHTFLEAMCLVDNINEVVRKLFEDVEMDRWSRTAIEYFAKHGLVAGFPDGTFRPEEPLTREQGMQLAYNVLKKVGKLDENTSDSGSR